MTEKGLLESQVQSQCLNLLRSMNVFVWRQNTGAFKVKDRYIKSGIKGVSDILGIWPDGRFLAIEVKREKGGRLSEAQKEFLQEIKNNHGIAIVCHSVEELEKELSKL